MVRMTYNPLCYKYSVGEITREIWMTSFLEHYIRTNKRRLTFALLTYVNAGLALSMIIQNAPGSTPHSVARIFGTDVVVWMAITFHLWGAICSMAFPMSIRNFYASSFPLVAYISFTFLAWIDRGILLLPTVFASSIYFALIIIFMDLPENE